MEKNHPHSTRGKVSTTRDGDANASILATTATASASRRPRLHRRISPPSATFSPTFPRASKFRKKAFPLFEALGELYDGQYAEGTWNFTSTQLPRYSILSQVNEGDQLSSTGVEFPDVEESYAYQAQEDGDARPQTTEEAVPQSTGEASVERTEQRLPRKAGAPPNKEEGKRPKKGAALEGALERYIDVKIQQAQDEAAVLAKEKELIQANDFSIRRCISILTKTTLPPDEKVKASEVFQIPANRETFISFNDDDPEIALLWLRGKVDNH